MIQIDLQVVLYFNFFNRFEYFLVIWLETLAFKFAAISIRNLFFVFSDQVFQFFV